jgi:hypothetical protein
LINTNSRVRPQRVLFQALCRERMADVTSGGPEAGSVQKTDTRQSR